MEKAKEELWFFACELISQQGAMRVAKNHGKLEELSEEGKKKSIRKMELVDELLGIVEGEINNCFTDKDMHEIDLHNDMVDELQSNYGVQGLKFFAKRMAQEIEFREQYKSTHTNKQNKNNGD